MELIHTLKNRAALMSLQTARCPLFNQARRDALHIRPGRIKPHHHVPVVIGVKPKLLEMDGPFPWVTYRSASDVIGLPVEATGACVAGPYLHP